MNEVEAFKITVQAFIEKHGISESGFGRKYAGDPNFYRDLFIYGREPKMSTRNRILGQIARDLSVSIPKQSS